MPGATCFSTGYFYPLYLAVGGLRPVLWVQEGVGKEVPLGQAVLGRAGQGRAREAGSERQVGRQRTRGTPGAGHLPTASATSPQSCLALAWGHPAPSCPLFLCEGGWSRGKRRKQAGRRTESSLQGCTVFQKSLEQPLGHPRPLVLPLWVRSLSQNLASSAMRFLPSTATSVTPRQPLPLGPLWRG